MLSQALNEVPVKWSTGELHGVLWIHTWGILLTAELSLALIPQLGSSPPAAHDIAGHQATSDVVEAWRKWRSQLDNRLSSASLQLPRHFRASFRGLD